MPKAKPAAARARHTAVPRHQQQVKLWQFLILGGVVIAVAAILLMKQAPAASPLTSLPSSALAPTLQVSAPQAPGAQSAAAQASVEKAPAPAELPEVQLMRALSAGTPTLAFFHSMTCDSCKEMTAIVAEVYPDYADVDDESFPMGGTLAKYTATGARVVLICAALGEAGIEGLAPAAAARIGKAELEAATRTLGVAELHLLGYLDGEVAQADETIAVEQITTLLNRLRPQVVITFGPDGISGHGDHVAVHRFAIQAFDRYVSADLNQAEQAPRLFYLAPSTATQQGCGIPAPSLRANGPVAAIDVGEHLVAKVRAAQCHVSQNPPFAGLPEVEAARLVCHEYFTLARPAVHAAVTMDDLFTVLSTQEGDPSLLDLTCASDAPKLLSDNSTMVESFGGESY